MIREPRVERERERQRRIFETNLSLKFPSSSLGIVSTLALSNFLSHLHCFFVSSLFLPQNDLEYLDENVERLARKQMKSDAMKRQFAIQDFARTKKALDECPFCWQNEGSSPPSNPIISSGIKTYLTLPSTEPLTSGHCYIVPMFHHLSLLEAEDDVWDEVRNFMKCLMRNAASKNEGVIFWETVVSLKWQKHSFIEAINLPMDLYQDMPAYFKVSDKMKEICWIGSPSSQRMLTSSTPFSPLFISTSSGIDSFFRIRVDSTSEAD